MGSPRNCGGSGGRAGDLPARLGSLSRRLVHAPFHAFGGHWTKVCGGRQRALPWAFHAPGTEPAHCELAEIARNVHLQGPHWVVLRGHAALHT